MPLVLAALGGLAHAQPQAHVKLATLAPKGTSFHQSLLEMGQQWRDAPGGGVRLTIYTDGTMGGELDTVRRMRVGQLQAAMLTVVGLSNIEESVSGLQNLPLMYQNLDEVTYIRQQLQPELEAKFQRKGFVVLFWGDAGWVYFFSRTPARMPEDFKRLKIFVWAGDNKMVDLWKISGYQPVPLEPMDILTGLKTHLIDAAPTTPAYALAGQFYGPAPHMLDLKIAPLVGGTVILAKVWDALPEATRAAMKKSAEEAGVKIQTRARAEAEESIQVMKRKGLTVHELTPEAYQSWEREFTAAYPRLRDRIVPGVMVDRVQKLLQEYRQSQAQAAP